jgi:hypothetical protein
MAHHIARWTFVIAILSLVPAAFAQTDNQPPPMAMPGEPPPPYMQAPMQSGPPPRGAAGAGIRTACGMDVQRLCYGVPRGGGRIVQCLMAHRGALSPTCSAELGTLRGGGGVAAMPPPGAPPPGMGPPPGNAPPPAGMAPPPAGNRAAFQASCGPDARLFCTGVPREDVAKCLGSHRTELSPTCKAYMQQMRAERGAQRNSPGYNPPPPPAASDMPPPPPPPPSSKGAPPAVATPPNE